MRVKCDYCGQQVDESLSYCPHCGGSLSTSNRVASDQPKTIGELQQWYAAHNLPPEHVTRFFIGKDIREPKAFGIYRDVNGDFVVYKNKANGERAVRYQGKDEGYAVNELYQRLRSEIVDQKEQNARNMMNNNRYNTGYNNAPQKKGLSKILPWLIAIPFLSPIITSGFTFFIFILVAIFDNSPAKGYYNYNGKDYYYQGSSWYSYNSTTDSWDYASNSSELDSIINNDNYSDYRTYDHDGSRFEDSNWYDSGTSDDSYDWDSDSSWSSSSDSWDSGSSWDSGGSDWDSDW